MTEYIYTYTLEDITRNTNLAMGIFVDALYKDGYLTKEEAEDIKKEYIMVCSKPSIFDRMKYHLKKKDFNNNPRFYAMKFVLDDDKGSDDESISDD